MDSINWKSKAMLVWKGRIVEKLPTRCEYGDYECIFECDEIEPFRLLVCSRLFVDKDNCIGDEVYIPMGFKMDGKLYNPATEDTPLSYLAKEK